MKIHKFTCSKCNQQKTHESDTTTGYGVDKSGNKICFQCCAEDDKKHMEQNNRITLYLTCEPAHKIKSEHGRNRVGYVSNWPGTLKIPCTTTVGRHNIAGVRYDCWFTDHSGNKWHGVQYGDNTQLVHCRKLKA